MLCGCGSCFVDVAGATVGVAGAPWMCFPLGVSGVTVVWLVLFG